MLAEIKNGGCVELRAATEEDLPRVLSLLGRAALPIEGVDEALPHFVLAESDGKLAGVVGLEFYGRTALLRSAAVEESWRGSGVGKVLVDRALDLARERGVEDIYLLTITAEGYFPKFGFACVSRDSVTGGVRSSVEFQTACPTTATVMRKKL